MRAGDAPRLLAQAIASHDRALLERRESDDGFAARRLRATLWCHLSSTSVISVSVVGRSTAIAVRRRAVRRVSVATLIDRRTPSNQDDAATKRAARP